MDRIDLNKSIEKDVFCGECGFKIPIDESFDSKKILKLKCPNCGKYINNNYRKKVKRIKIIAITMAIVMAGILIIVSNVKKATVVKNEESTTSQEENYILSEHEMLIKATELVNAYNTDFSIALKENNPEILYKYLDGRDSITKANLEKKVEKNSSYNPYKEKNFKGLWVKKHEYDPVTGIGAIAATECYEIVDREGNINNNYQGYSQYTYQYDVQTGKIFILGISEG